MEEIRLNFLLIGKTGEGKSATGNTLLDRPEFFKTSIMTTSHTKDVKCSFRLFGSYMLQVVDGPGMEDTDMNKVEDKETMIQHMGKALVMCYGGVDAFLLVIKFGQKFTAEDRSALESMKKIFGEDFLKHVIVVIAGGDLYSIAMEEEPNISSFDNWCNLQKGDFKKLYDDCKGRVVLINNKEKDSEKKLKQIQEIILHAHNLQEKNGRYTSQCFQLAEQAREKMIVELKVPQLKREIQEKVSLLVAELEKYSANPSESQKESIRIRIRELKSEIQVQDKGYGVLKEMETLTDEVERNLNDLVQLKFLATQLELTKVAKISWLVCGSFMTFVALLLFVSTFPVSATVVAVASTVAAASATISSAIGTVGGYQVLESNQETLQQEHDSLKSNINKKK